MTIFNGNMKGIHTLLKIKRKIEKFGEKILWIRDILVSYIFHVISNSIRYDIYLVQIISYFVHWEQGTNVKKIFHNWLPSRPSSDMEGCPTILKKFSKFLFLFYFLFLLLIFLISKIVITTHKITKNLIIILL